MKPIEKITWGIIIICLMGFTLTSVNAKNKSTVPKENINNTPSTSTTNSSSENRNNSDQLDENNPRQPDNENPRFEGDSQSYEKKMDGTKPRSQSKRKRGTNQQNKESNTFPK